MNPIWIRVILNNRDDQQERAQYIDAFQGAAFALQTTGDVVAEWVGLDWAQSRNLPYTAGTAIVGDYNSNGEEILKLVLPPTWNQQQLLNAGFQLQSDTPNQGTGNGNGNKSLLPFKGNNSSKGFNIPSWVTGVATAFLAYKTADANNGISRAVFGAGTLYVGSKYFQKKT